MSVFSVKTHNKTFPSTLLSVITVIFVATLWVDLFSTVITELQ